MSASILNEELQVLIRESLEDVGGHNCVNHSPDIIVLKSKLKNPTVELREYYGEDISQDNDNSGQMYIYVRLKNISGKKLTDIYVHLYRNHLGLYNHPKDWSPYKMETENGPAVHIKSLEPGEVCVTSPFLYKRSETTGNSNCFVAVATREPEPSYSDICTYEKYLQWINKPNVAARNVSVRRRSTVPQEQKVPIKGLGRPSSTLMGFYVRVLECHSEARYGICQKDLLIDEEKVCFASGSYIFHVATVPSTFEGQLLIWSESSHGSPLALDITLWDLILSPCGEALEKYYVNLEEHLNDIPVMTAVTRATDQANTIPITVQGTLLGGCRLIYQ